MKQLLFFLALFGSVAGYAQSGCSAGETQFTLQLLTDNFPSETSWDVTDDQGTIYLFGTVNDTVFCLPDTNCYTFTIYDTFGDGICCTQGQGAYTVIVDADTVAQGGDFGHNESIMFNCWEGSNCNTPFVVTEGDYLASTANTWYAFSPDSSGIFEVTTCSTNTCNTKLWIYDYCQGLIWDNTNIGTIYYDDNNGGCGLQAVVMAQLVAGETYYIRVGTVNGDCTEAINWSIHHNGTIFGCTDPAACNYNPLATQSDTCIYASADCLSGPDLVVMSDVLQTSMSVDQISNTDECMVAEGCIRGYGLRDVVKFTTHIKNIGDQDYFIGTPDLQNPQFTYDNCHGHYHHKGYAEYVLYDSAGQALPIGFKNGFCVMDLECNDGGTHQYGCNSMGISSGCGDIYNAGLPCQWIDITDVPDGYYTLAVKVNWGQDPDALGNHEQDYTNNWAQVCFFLDRSSGSPAVILDTTCASYTDCAGVAFGNAQYDCNGICNGTAIMGDLNLDSTQNISDAMEYVSNILGGDTTSTHCHDLNADSSITIYDAALIASCQHYGATHDHGGSGGHHDHCHFPYGITNILDSVYFSIIGRDPANQYIDIGIRNPNNRVTAFQFKMEGIEITSVDNLIWPSNFPVTMNGDFGGTQITGISYVDSSIEKSVDVIPLCRVYYHAITAPQICIESIREVVNDNYERTLHFTEGGCIHLTNISDPKHLTTISVAPNPSNGHFQLSYGNQQQQLMNIVICNALGQTVYQNTIKNADTGKLEINLSDMAKGMYTLVIKTPNSSVFSEKIALLH